jgi:hypothetical protein
MDALVRHDLQGDEVPPGAGDDDLDVCDAHIRVVSSVTATEPRHSTVYIAWRPAFAAPLRAAGDLLAKGK